MIIQLSPSHNGPLFKRKIMLSLVMSARVVVGYHLGKKAIHEERAVAEASQQGKTQRDNELEQLDRCLTTR